MLKKLIKDQHGYGTVEFMIIFVAAAVLAGTVLTQLLPNIKSLHETTINNIKNISGSGY